jgi:hypothetical protein
MWVLMFLGPAEEHKRTICESHPFFCSSPLFCAPLPTSHAPATLTPRSPRVGHPGSAPATPGRPLPCLDRAPAARPHPAARVDCRSHLPRPRPACPRSSTPSHPASLHRRSAVRAPPSPRAYPDPAPPRSTCRPPGPARPRFAQQRVLTTRPRSALAAPRLAARAGRRPCPAQQRLPAARPRPALP